MKNYLIGLDIGTSAIKGVLLSADGTGDAVTGRSPFVYTRGEDQSVEISAEDYLESCLTLIRELTSKVPDDGVVVGVAAASASGNTLLLDENGKPTTPIINWQDHRVTTEAKEIFGENFDRKSYYLSTGWSFGFKSFPLAHLSWLYKHEPEKLKNADSVCMSTEYLYKELTGEYGISTSAGTPFFLIDQRTGKYNTQILDLFGIPETKVPPVFKVGQVVGKVNAHGAEISGLPVGTPVCAGTFDHPSAARGVGVLKEGQMLLSCGTSWVGFYPINDRNVVAENKMLIDPFLSDYNGPWGGMISLEAVSLKLDDYIQKFIATGSGRFKTFESYSKQSEPGAGGLTIKMNEEDDETLIASYPKHHIARAMMECICTMLKAEFDVLQAGGVHADTAVMVGGPTECPFWTEIIEQFTGMKVEIRHGAFAGARGAAMVAGIGAGLWKNEAEAFKIIG